MTAARGRGILAAWEPVFVALTAGCGVVVALARTAVWCVVVAVLVAAYA